VIRFEPDKSLLRLSVGDLVHYGAEPAVRQAPALGLRLTAGTREHREWQHATESSAATGDFVAEVALEYETSLRGVHVAVDGRIDGLRRESTGVVVEEVKTVVLPDEAWIEDELTTSVLEGAAYRDYRFQLEIYLLMVDARSPNELFPDAIMDDATQEPPRGRLVFRNLACEDMDRREIAVEIKVEVEQIRDRVHERLETILDDLAVREDRRLQAAELAKQLPFPFPTYRAHQEEIRDAAFEALEAGNNLLLAAPPGLGKTAAVLHAALRFALPRGFKVFWLTAKTTQQRLVAETVRLTLDRLPPTDTKPDSAPPLRAIVLRAREKICPNVEDGGRVFCHDSYCRYARDHWRKVRQHHVLDDLLELPVIEPDEVYARSVRAEACPYEVSLSGAAEADLIIGDYNYIFDPTSNLKRLDLDRIAGRAILVIDEAHNLLSRGRESHSPALERRLFETLFECARSEAAAATEEIHRTTGHFLERLAEIAETADFRPGADAARIDMDDDFLDEFTADLERWRTRRLMDKRAAPVILPDALDDALDACSKALRRFLSMLDLEEQRTSFAPLLERQRQTEQLRLLCLDPSSLLGKRLSAFHAAIAMSATLSPLDFFRDMLGFPIETTRTLSFPTPFPRQNRGVFVDPSFATTYRKRSGDAARIAKTADALALQRPGNYLVFLSSYSYQREVVAHVDRSRIGHDVLVQRRAMNEADRDRYLDLLREPGSNRILYAVQGGIFGEGVDYPGNMATAVIVVGPGLPRFDYEQELIREHFDQRYDKGFEYAYLYPGMHRVIQAAGRLIRSPNDVGVIVLLGERFADSQFTRLFPEDWYETTPRELITADLIGDVQAFWDARS
jgi:DNA excision repair protein ERCC-2